MFQKLEELVKNIESAVFRGNTHVASALLPDALTAIKTAFADLEARLSTLENGGVAVASGSTASVDTSSLLSTIESRIASVEIAVISSGATVKADIMSEVAKLKTELSTGTAALGSVVSSLEGRFAALEQTVTGLSTTVATDVADVAELKTKKGRPAKTDGDAEA